MRVYFSNLGCKLNQAEVDRLARGFVAAGHVLAPRLEQADLHVVNTCTVTHLAARDSRKIARRGHRQNAAMRTVLTGCYATDSPEEAASLAGVDLVVPNRDKEALLEKVHTAFPELVPGESCRVPVPYVPLDFGHARALVKVEDGCNMRCSFCIIPSTRGRQRSRPVEEVVAEVEALAAGGYAEVVVTGVQISEYDDHGRRLYDLVSALLERTSIPRLRLTSIAPWKFDHRLLELWRDPRLARHVHMSLQSGCTATLRRMRRPYTAEQCAELAGELRAAIPGLALTTDVIVGFPGETEDEFRQSLEFVGEMAFARPHVFTYSPREGTHAATLPGEVPHVAKKARVAEMLAVAARSERAFWQSQVGQKATVVWEELRRNHTGDERLTGLTDHYIRVFAPSAWGSEADLGRLAGVRLEAMEEKGMLATPLRPPSAPTAGSRAQGPSRQNAPLFQSAFVPASFLARS